MTSCSHSGHCDKKHRFQGKNLPDLKPFRTSVHNLLQKLKWAYKYRADFSSPKMRLGKRSFTPFCTDPGPLELQALCSAMRSRLLQAGCVAASSCRGLGNVHSNLAGFHRFSFRWLKQSNYRIINTDKDGCFALIRRDDLLAWCSVSSILQPMCQLQKALLVIRAYLS